MAEAIITPPRLLTAREVAEILQISRSAAYLLMQLGEIPSVRIGRSRRVRAETLERFIRERESGGER